MTFVLYVFELVLAKEKTAMCPLVGQILIQILWFVNYNTVQFGENEIPPDFQPFLQSINVRILFLVSAVFL